VKGFWLISLTLCLTPLAANAGGSEMQTVFGGVLCETPFQLRKAITAANRGESEWVWQLGCMRAGDGTKVVLFDQIALPFGPWKVQFTPDGGSSRVLWGYSSSFKVNSDATPPSMETASSANQN
jgi:hypothetical protein